MAVTDGKVIFPTSIGEVAELLGEETRDLGRLCVSSKINKYARYKPIHAGGFRCLTDAERIAANNGLTIPRYTTLAALRDAILNSDVAWGYKRPANHYRLTDFDRYNHGENWPLTGDGETIFNGYVLISTDDGNIYSGTSITLWIDYEDPDQSYTPLLYPSDWDQTSTDNLRALRLGFVLINASTDEIWFRGASGTLAEGNVGLTATIPVAMSNSITWTIIPVLTDRSTDYFVGTDASGIYIPIEGKYISCQKLAEDPNASLRYSADGVVLETETELTVMLRNNTLAEITVDDLYLVISSEGAYDSQWAYVEVAASTWLADNKLDDTLPVPGGALLDGTGKVCQRLYSLLSTMRDQLGTATIPPLSSVEFLFSIPAIGDDYGSYDNYTYTAFLTNDTKSGYDVTEFTVTITDKAASCFANGYWDNMSPWTNDLGWKNVP